MICSKIARKWIRMPFKWWTDFLINWLDQFAWLHTMEMNSIILFWRNIWTNWYVDRIYVFHRISIDWLLTVFIHFYIFCHVQNCSLDGNLLCVDSLQIFRLIDKCSSFIKGSYKLIDIYRRLFQSDPVDAHSAEGDAMILFKCVVLSRFAFVAMADLKAVNFNKTQFDWNFLSEITINTKIILKSCIEKEMTNYYGVMFEYFYISF